MAAVTHQSDIARVVDAALADLKLDTPELHEAYSYSSISLCVLDAIFSIGVRYESTEAVVARYCATYGLARLRESRDALPEIASQEPLDQLVSRIQATGPEEFAAAVVRNRQRTSARNGVLKAAAVAQFASVLVDAGIRYFQDLPAYDESSDLHQRLRAVRGQGSGVAIGYFWMLAGSAELIKPDRMILRYLDRCLGRTTSVAEARVLLAESSAALGTQYSTLNPRLLDYLIWEYERARPSMRAARGLA